MTAQYAENKPIWSPVAEGKMLSSVPQLRHLYAEAEETATLLEAFVGRCEERLAPCNRRVTAV